MPRFKLPPKLPFRSIGLAGLGLIGGSLAKAFMPFSGLELNVFDHDPQTVREAKKIRRFRRVTDDPEEFAQWPADLFYLCLPVSHNIQMIRRLGRLKCQSAVTDSGSTKGSASQAALEEGLNFCGGHPIAGKEVAGFAHSSADLISGCLFILTPDSRYGPRQTELLAKLRNLHELLGCRIRIMSPGDHDQLYSLVSHLPYLTASALSGTAMEKGGPDVLPWVGTGFKDTTRTGASPPAKWVEVVLDNAENLTQDLGALIDLLSRMKDILQRRDTEEMTELLGRISSFRQKLT
ncbi:MAG: prephenate dehydrogenase [Deltaproteobacteria bacterium]|jgi:prephenate dehydrogenase|nr:prephenate dehydrogenase [Deltaproteobacteria bacterium]